MTTLFKNEKEPLNINYNEPPKIDDEVYYIVRSNGTYGIMNGTVNTIVIERKETFNREERRIEYYNDIRVNAGASIRGTLGFFHTWGDEAFYTHDECVARLKVMKESLFKEIEK